MDNKLTPEEIRIAEKHILKYEKGAREWRVQRWILLIISLALFVYSFVSLNKAESIYNARLQETKIETDGTAKKDLINFIDKKNDLFKLELYLDLKIYGSALLSIILVVSTLARWLTGERDMFYVKGLRILVSNSVKKADKSI